MNKNLKIFTNGIITENPTLRLVLGTCPTLAVTTSAKNGIGMGLAATVVLVCSNAVISLLRKVIPDKVRIPAFITIIAGFVSVVQMLVKAFAPSIDKSLGIFLPLIVVNCIILARAEMFASKNSLVPSVLDGLGMGIGFTCTLTLMGIIRELLGAGTIGAGFFDKCIDMANHLTPMVIFLLPPGGFFVFGMLVALSNAIAKKNGKKTVDRIGCENCPSRAVCDRANCENEEVAVNE
ncbi:MAG: electron transport complex subunit E [Clostridia bacterium]|nr:electron transport complex subunit E [Clostridia bacterium]